MEWKLRIGVYFQVICNIYLGKSEYDMTRDYALKALDVLKDLNLQIASGLLLLGHSYFLMGNINKALELIQESLSVEGIADLDKPRSLYILGDIYRTKGLLDLSLEKYKEGFRLAKESSNFLYFGSIFRGFLFIY